MTFRKIGSFLLTNRWNLDLWECPGCFAVVSDVTAHEERCPNRPRSVCTLRAGMLLSTPCACGHPATVHGPPGITCSLCPPRT